VICQSQEQLMSIPILPSSQKLTSKSPKPTSMMPSTVQPCSIEQDASNYGMFFSRQLVFSFFVDDEEKDSHLQINFTQAAFCWKVHNNCSLSNYLHRGSRGSFSSKEKTEKKFFMGRFFVEIAKLNFFEFFVKLK
jgi:hypothetical protein